MRIVVNVRDFNGQRWTYDYDVDTVPEVLDALAAHIGAATSDRLEDVYIEDGGDGE